jgi:predicted enzyme related to lactoylglutathione lyase
VAAGRDERAAPGPLIEMFAHVNAFSSFAVDDLETALRFYGETLGLETSVLDPENGMMSLNLAGGRIILIYTKPDVAPPNYTMLNFPVDDVEKTVDELTARGVVFERYAGFNQDEKGITRGPGPEIAWFKDPAGNILAVIGTLGAMSLVGAAEAP